MPKNTDQKISRRDFFRRSVKTVTEASDKKSLELAKLWFRPPFAQNEIDFLDACTKCGRCIENCPPHALFPLHDKYGLRAAGTPALDLINSACSLCEDWPCVGACESRALIIPTPEIETQEGREEEIPLKPMAIAVIDKNRCIAFSGPECGACAHACPVKDALQWNGPKPYINEEACVGCGLCRQACITDPKAISMTQMIHVEQQKV
ncbi:MAG: 4Fe-4S dicluster domain-containing protein [Amylibacter sp.]